MSEITDYPDRDPWFDLQSYYHTPDAYESLKALLKNLPPQFNAEQRRHLKRFVRLARERFGSTLGLTEMNPDAASINDWLEERCPGIDLWAETVTVASVADELEVAAGNDRARDRTKARAKKQSILWHGGREYSIGVHGRKTLIETEHMVLQAFLAKPSLQTMDKPTLCRLSVEHAPRVLYTLKKKYEGIFAAAISTPDGKKGNGGYGVRIKSAVTQRHQSRT